MANHIFIFDLPHIQDTVTQYLSRADLQHCALVSKTWHPIFIPFYWHTLDTDLCQISALLACTDSQHSFQHSHSRHVWHLSTPRPEILAFLSHHTQLKSLSLPLPTIPWHAYNVPSFDSTLADFEWSQKHGFKELFDTLERNPRLEKFSMKGFPEFDHVGALEIVSHLIQSREMAGKDSLECMKEISLCGLQKNTNATLQETLLRVVQRIGEGFPKLKTLRLDFAQCYPMEDLAQTLEGRREARRLEDETLERRSWSMKHLVFGSQRYVEEPLAILLDEILSRSPNLETLDLECVTDDALNLIRYHVLSEHASPSTLSLTPRMTNLRGLTFRNMANDLDDDALANLLDAFPVGQLHQVQLYIPMDATRTYTSLERHAAELEEVQLNFYWAMSHCPPMVQTLLSRGKKLKKIRVYGGTVGVMKMSAAEIVMGDPWVCDQLEEWVMGIMDVPRCPQQYQRGCTKEPLDQGIILKAGCEEELVQEMDEAAITVQENVQGDDVEESLMIGEDNVQANAIGVDEEDEEDEQDDNDHVEDSDAEEEGQDAIRRRQQLELMDKFYEEHLKSVFDPVAHSASPRVTSFDFNSTVIDTDPSTAIMTPERIKSLAIQRQIMGRFSELTHLRILSLSPQYNPQHDCLEFSIESGLDLLVSCPGLEELIIRGHDTWIGQAEVKWMRTHWPKLAKVEGLMNHDVEARKQVGMNAYAKDLLRDVQIGM